MRQSNAKSLIYRIVLQDFPATRAVFPFKYFGLPLSLTRLRKVDFQHLIDKAVNRLANWQGKLLTLANRTTLVKSVLTSLPVYYLTALTTPKSSLRAIDKMQRRFPNVRTNRPRMPSTIILGYMTLTSPESHQPSNWRSSSCYASYCRECTSTTLHQMTLSRSSQPRANTQQRRCMRHNS